VARFIFLKYLRSIEEFRKNPHVKIPPKSPCANFQSHDIFNNSIFIRKGIFLKFRPIRPSPARVSPLCPAGHRIPTRPTRPKPHCHICQKAYSLRLCALRLRCLLSLTSLPSGAHLSAPSPSPHWPTVAASPRRLRPPHAARPPTSRCQARSSLPALIPPLNPPPPKSSSSRPAINGVKAITVGRFPLRSPGVPLPDHYKRARSTPRPSPHSPRHHLLTPEPATSTPPSASSAGCSPPSHGRVHPSVAPSCSR
jgi:hypothetical protein